MSRYLHQCVVVAMTLLAVASGCHPTQPFYFHEDGDLSHLVEVATDLEEPDVAAPRLPDAHMSQEPLTVVNPDFEKVWELSLEECFHLALQNTKTIRTLAGVTAFGISDGLVGRTGGATVYDPAITETDPQQGVEAALSTFDAQFNTSVFWDTRDRPQNFDPGGIATNFFPAVSRQVQGTYIAELNKTMATGGQVFFRNRTIHDDGNQGGNSRAVPTTWETNFEIELRQPLARGRGVQVNRVPVMLARINTDISLATFEANVRNMAQDLENAYWDLLCAYRAVETAKAGRDSAQATWQRVYRLMVEGAGGGDKQAEAQAREQYFFFRSALEAALGGNPSTGDPGLLARENRLRFLMGLAATDGRLIRPSDVPVMARVQFDWHAIHSEALVRSPELRQQRWRIKQRDLQLLQAKNQLLPQVDLVALYRWLGVGDHLGLTGGGSGLNFPNLQDPLRRRFGGSQAFDELFEGDYQEARIGVQMTMPVGFRRELAAVRNVQLLKQRETAVLQDMELNQSHLLSQAIRDLHANYRLAQSHFNRWRAAEEEVQATLALFKNDKITIDRVLDAQRRRALAQIDYHRAICEYNKAIAGVHFRKGSLLDYNNMQLAEGPWPKKAYWDAMGHARERDASYYLNYGWTRPGVVGKGSVRQGSGIRGHVPVPAGEEPSDGSEAQPPQGPLTMNSAGGLDDGVVQAAFEEPADAQPANPFQWGGLGIGDSTGQPTPARRPTPEQQPTPARRPTPAAEPEIRQPTPAARMDNPLRD